MSNQIIKSVGVIGIGAMGRGIALNLLKNRMPLTIYDTNNDNINNFIKLTNNGTVVDNKVNIANSIQDLTNKSDVICLSLPRYIILSLYYHY